MIYLNNNLTLALMKGIVMHSTYLNEPDEYRLLKTTHINFYAHFHQQAEIAYCSKGTLNILINGIYYTLNAGDVAVIWPNQRHFYKPSQPDDNNLYYLLLFYPSYTESFYEDWINKYPEKPIVTKRQLPDFFPELWELFYKACPINEEETTALFHNAYPKAYRNTFPDNIVNAPAADGKGINESENIPDVQSYTPYRGRSEIFKAYTAVLTAHIMPQLKLYFSNKSTFENDTQAVLNYVNQHFTEKISLSQTSHELGISTANLSQIFSSVIGCSFMSHVNSLRIAHAKRLLRSSSYSINEICTMSGFQSKRTFFRNFQKMCGQTPAQFRKKALSDN